MTKIRKFNNSGAEVLPWDTLQDTTLSFTALGLLAYCLSLPPDWKFDAERIAKTRPEGLKAVRGAFKELEAAGYRRLVTEHGERGRITRWAEFAYQPVAEWVEEYRAKEAAKVARGKPKTRMARPARAAAVASLDAIRDEKGRASDQQESAFPQVAPKVHSPSVGGVSFGGPGEMDVSAGRTESAFTARRSSAGYTGVTTEREIYTHTSALTSADGRSVLEAESVCVSEAAKDEPRPAPAAIDGMDVEAVVVRVIDAAMPPTLRGRLTAAERRDIAETVAECLGTGHHPAAITRRVNGVCNDATLKPAMWTLRGLRELAKETPDAPTPPQRGDKRSVGRSGGLKGRCSRGSECRDGRLVCSTDLDVCGPLCKGKHEARGKQCPDCSGSAASAAAGPSFEQQLTKAMGTQPGLMGLDGHAA